MVQVKKISKYSKYFLFLAIASTVSFIWPSKNSGQSSVLPTVPHAYADVPTEGVSECNVNCSSGSDDGGGCP